MNLWLMASVALLCALAGVALGWWFSRLRGPYWMIGYFIPVTLVFVYALGFYVPGVLFMPPFSWLMLGIRKFMVFGFITTLVLTTPMLRLPHRRTRVTIAAMMAVIVFGMCLLPFITPMLDREQLSHLKTNLDRNGVCLAVVPANMELDEKALARLTGDRKTEMVPLKEVQPLTGYIRGGVTALACKGSYPVYVDETAELFDVISVSAGVRGTQVLLTPADYLSAVRGVVGEISRNKR